MSKQFMLRALQLSPVIFGCFGLLAGFVFSSAYTEGFMWLGVCLGSFVGFCVSAGYLLRSDRNYSTVATVLFNLVLFYIVAKEIQIIN